MADYIERQAALDLIESAGAWGWSKNQLYEEMQGVPASPVREDVQSVWISSIETAYGPMGKNGNLIEREIKKFYCRECGKGTVIKENFCPHCGARMIGVE